jgi:hypothetical protein
LRATIKSCARDARFAFNGVPSLALGSTGKLRLLPELKLFPKSIKECSDSHELQRLLGKDADYIWRAYNRIETYWFEEFRRFETIRIILLSEAPFFGESESYFYNPNCGATQFFGYTDYTQSLGEWGPELHAGRNAPVPKKKAELLAAMREVGVIVLDIFPFALNPKTNYTYANLRHNEYADLFAVAAPLYFRPKLKHLVNKMAPDGKFVFRYRRVQDAAEALVEQELESSGLKRSQLHCDNVGSRGGHLNRPKLKSIYAEVGT